MRGFANFIFLLALSSLAAAQTPGSSSSSSSVKHPRRPATVAASQPDPGSVINGTYRNSAFAFTCQIPAGWVLRTDEMNQREDNSAPAAGRVLLAAFSRPPAAHGEDVNSSILIAAEPVAIYPGLQEAVQYFGPLAEIAKAQGFLTVNDPYEIAVGTRSLVRSDYQKDVGSRVMMQSTLVMLSRGFAVSFTFIGGTEDEVEDLVDGLNFGAVAKPH